MNNVLSDVLKNKKDQNIMISALDIGTSKVVVIVAELQSDGVLKIIGKGQHVSKGLKKGVVVNIDNTMHPEPVPISNICNFEFFGNMLNTDSTIISVSGLGISTFSFI